jgi:hypothetical protein
MHSMPGRQLLNKFASQFDRDMHFVPSWQVQRGDREWQRINMREMSSCSICNRVWLHVCHKMLVLSGRNLHDQVWVELCK